MKEPYQVTLQWPEWLADFVAVYEPDREAFATREQRMQFVIDAIPAERAPADRRAVCRCGLRAGFSAG
jgi:hypothetical protein